jgi:hypothetical protein
MDDVNRNRLVAQFQRDFRRDHGCLSNHLKDVAVGLDTFLDSEGALANSYIPQPARGLVSTQTKLEMMAYVALRRAGKLKAEED